MTISFETASAARTTSQAVAATIRRRISSGELVSGEKLRQVALAEAFGVSTTPVREALAQLRHEGLVRMHPQRGATVFVPTREDLAEHYEIRIALEVLAIKKTAVKFKPRLVPSFSRILDEMAQCRDPQRYVEMNHQFHMELYDVAGNERLSELIADLRSASNAYLQIYASHRPPTADIDREHRAILSACADNDPDRAAASMERHLGHTVAHVGRQIEIPDSPPCHGHTRGD